MDFSQINVPLVVGIATFLSVCLLIIGIMIYVRQSRTRRAMLEKIASTDEWIMPQEEAQKTDLTGTKSSEGILFRFIHRLGQKTKADKSAEDFQIKLKFLRAGIRDRNAPTTFWGVKLLLSISMLSLFIGFFVFYKPSMQPLHVLVIAAGMGLLGLFLPDYWLWKKAINRRNRIIKGFPDALDMLVVCVEAGMGLDAAINRVGLELELSQPDLSEEFKLLNLELRAGKARAAALKSMGERINADDVDSLITLLLQTDRFGTSVGQALRVYSETFRTKRYQRAEEAAAKISTKLLFPLITCIFPAMFTVLLGPAAIQIYRVLIQK